jgi:enoyl-CoA hydratase/carnithine racemase
MVSEAGFEVTRDGPVASIWLDRIDHGNRLTNPMIGRLTLAIREFSSAGSPALIALRHRGDDFCLGRDPGADSRAGLTAYDVRAHAHRVILNAYEALRAAPVPVVAVVRGRAAGFGAAMVSACDIVLAADGATFSLPEIEQGFPPTLAMTAFLGKVPQKALCHLVLDGRPIPAAQALQIGLVSATFPDQLFERSVADALERLGRRPKTASETVKLFMREAAFPASHTELASALLALARTAGG